MAKKRRKRSPAANRRVPTESVVGTPADGGASRDHDVYNALDRINPTEAAKRMAVHMQMLEARMKLHCIWKFGHAGDEHSSPIEPVQDEDQWHRENGELVGRIVAIQALSPKGGPILDELITGASLGYDISVMAEDYLREYLPLLSTRGLVAEEVNAWRDLMRRASRISSRISHALPRLSTASPQSDSTRSRDAVRSTPLVPLDRNEDIVLLLLHAVGAVDQRSCYPPSFVAEATSLTGDQVAYARKRLAKKQLIESRRRVGSFVTARGQERAESIRRRHGIVDWETCCDAVPMRHRRFAEQARQDIADRSE